MNRRHRSLTASLPHRPSCSSWCRCQGETNRCLSPRVILILPPSSAWLTWRFPQRGQGALATASPSTRAETSTSRLRGEHEKPGRQAMKREGEGREPFPTNCAPFVPACVGFLWVGRLGCVPAGQDKTPAMADDSATVQTTRDDSFRWPLAATRSPSRCYGRRVTRWRECCSHAGIFSAFGFHVSFRD